MNTSKTKTTTTTTTTTTTLAVNRYSIAHSSVPDVGSSQSNMCLQWQHINSENLLVRISSASPALKAKGRKIAKGVESLGPLQVQLVIILSTTTPDQLLESVDVTAAASSQPLDNGGAPIKVLIKGLNVGFKYLVSIDGIRQYRRFQVRFNRHEDVDTLKSILFPIVPFREAKDMPAPTVMTTPMVTATVIPEQNHFTPAPSPEHLRGLHIPPLQTLYPGRIWSNSQSQPHALMQNLHVQPQTLMQNSQSQPQTIMQNSQSQPQAIQNSQLLISQQPSSLMPDSQRQALMHYSQHRPHILMHDSQSQPSSLMQGSQSRLLSQVRKSPGEQPPDLPSTPPTPIPEAFQYQPTSEMSLSRPRAKRSRLDFGEPELTSILNDESYSNALIRDYNSLGDLMNLTDEGLLRTLKSELENPEFRAVLKRLEPLVPLLHP